MKHGTACLLVLAVTASCTPQGTDKDGSRTVIETEPLSDEFVASLRAAREAMDDKEGLRSGGGGEQGDERLDDASGAPGPRNDCIELGAETSEHGGEYLEVAAHTSGTTGERPDRVLTPPKQGSTAARVLAINRPWPGGDPVSAVRQPVAPLKRRPAKVDSGERHIGTTEPPGETAPPGDLPDDEAPKASKAGSEMQRGDGRTSRNEPMCDGTMASDEVSRLWSVASDASSWQSSRECLVAHFHAAGDDARERRALEELLQDPANRYKPGLLLEMAVLELRSGSASSALKWGRLAERHQSRLTGEDMYRYYAKIQEVQAKTFELRYRQGRDPLDLEKAINHWRRYQTLVSEKGDDLRQQEAEKALTKLSAIQRRTP